MQKLPNFETKINYCGEELNFQEAFNETLMPNWDKEAQAIINDLRRYNKKACVIHKGIWHGLYSED